MPDDLTERELRDMANGYSETQARFRTQLFGNMALRHAQEKTPQNLLDIASQNAMMHKNFQGQYCFPVQVKGSGDEPRFRIDEQLKMYVCLSCGEMWPYINYPTPTTGS